VSLKRDIRSFEIFLREREVEQARDIHRREDR
jgi:hypothetical protein